MNLSFGKVHLALLCAGFVLLPGLLAFEPAGDRQQHPIFIDESVPDGKLYFELRHVIHRGSLRYPSLHRRIDLPASDDSAKTANVQSTTVANKHYSARSRPTKIQRLKHRKSEFVTQRLFSLDTHVDEWTVDDIKEPDITDKETVLSLARMANDAYHINPDESGWQDIGAGFNYTNDFGWERDGLRGHVFVDKTNQTVVIAMKGTSLPFIDPIGTIGNDKLNDNLLFGCCCGQGGRWAYSQVCQCQIGDGHVANTSCLESEIREKSRYYHLALELYHNVTELYPGTNVWLAGHSLGGSVASLLGLTVGQPAVTFEAPADAMAALRLGLATPPGFHLGNSSARAPASEQPHHPSYHFGHTADDIFMGKCNALTSICTVGGYAMESMCHTGAICIYDTIKDKNWTADAVSNHGIEFVIKDVIDSYDKPAGCTAQTDCTDCEEWRFV